MIGDASADSATQRDRDPLTKGTAPARLEIDAISKRYGDTVAVEALSFDVRAGELFGFVGRNGAGYANAAMRFGPRVRFLDALNARK